MNVWLINHYAKPYARHHALARHLVRSGNRVVMFASSFNHKTRQEGLSPGEKVRRENVDGVDFVWLRTPPYRGNSPARVKNMLAFALRACESRLPASAERPDVVVGSSPHLFAALAAERVARRYGVPFVLEVRDLWPESLVQLGNVSPRHPIVLGLGLIERYLYRRARCIVSLLPGAVDHMALKGADREKVVWIPNGVEVDELPEPKPPVNDGTTFTIAYAGAHGLANALDTLLDVAYSVQTTPWGGHVRFQLIGDGPEKARLQARAREEGIRNINFGKQVPRSQVYDILSRADAFWMTLRDIPLYKWGISLNKMYDYLAMARPIVFGADVVLNPVKEAQAGLTVFPEDSTAMVDAIRRLVVMPDEDRWAMGIKGRHYVEEHHDYKTLAGRLEEHLRASIGKSG